MRPHLTVRALQPVVAGLDALGLPVDDLLEGAGLARSTLEDPDGYVRPEAMATLWRLALDISGDDMLGLHIAQAAPVESFDVHAYAVLSSPTLRDAYRRACRYQRLIHGSNHLTLEETESAVELRHALPGGRSVSRQPAEFLVASWLRFGRLVSGDDWVPLGVWFDHDAPGRRDEHDRLFGPAVRYRSGRTAMRVPGGILDRPNPSGDPTLLRLLDRHATTLLETRPAGETVSDRVRAFLADSHGVDGTTATEAARALHMSPRNLRRRLAGENTSFRELLDGYRHQRAVELLADAGNGIADVAFLLGFSDLSAFYRAFRRWSGTTPADYRADPP